jgi:hypothetical protein
MNKIYGKSWEKILQTLKFFRRASAGNIGNKNYESTRKRRNCIVQCCRCINSNTLGSCFKFWQGKRSFGVRKSLHKLIKTLPSLRPLLLRQIRLLSGDIFEANGLEKAWNEMKKLKQVFACRMNFKFMFGFKVSWKLALKCDILCMKLEFSLF